MFTDIPKKLTYLLILSIILIFTFTTKVSAQQKEEIIELLHADSSHWNLEEDNIIISLFGDVRFKHGSTFLNSDRAIWYKTAGQIVFLGKVKIEDEDIFLFAQKLTYYQRIKKVVAENKVKLLSKKEDIIITGERGEYDREKKYVIFIQSPKLEIHPEKPDSTITVTADTMEYFSDQKKGVAKKEVHIKKGDMDAYCGLAELFRQDKEDRVFLKENPFAFQKQNEISGNLMELLFKKRLLEKIIVNGKAKASQKEDTLGTKSESYVTGEKICFLLKDENLEEVEVEGNATSLYIPSSEDTTKKIRNEASGDTISLFLEKNQLKKVLIQGGAIGTYYQTYPPNPNDSLFITDTIRYSAQKIDYLVDDSLIILENHCKLKFETISLDAGKVEFYTNKEILIAQGILKEVGEGKKLCQIPVLKDREEKITGERMVYNIKTRRGKIDVGKTEFQKGLYYGQKLRKVDQETILADKGIYTTCDLENPHYHFFSSKMKIIPEDKVIAKPIILYIKDIPIATIPFYVFPIKPGRHSGFLTFELGSFEANDRFIRNLGYYWAASDYWDVQGAFDLYENSGWIIKGFLRYAKRYFFNGTIAGSYNRKSQWTGFYKSKTTRWDILFRHSQTISPSTRLSAKGQFLSDKNYYKIFSFDPRERRNRSLHSQANLSTRWKNAGMYIAVDRSVNLDTDTKVDKLPTFTLTLPAFRPFGYPEKGESSRWYQSLYLKVGSDFLNYSYKKEEIQRKKFTTLDNRVNLQFPQKLFGSVSLSPNFNYRETWYFIPETDMSKDENIKANSLCRRGIPSLSLNANTKLYGTFYPKIGPITGFRHVVTPTFSFIWKPEIKKHDKLLFYTGKGGAGRKQRTLSFSLSNILWMKTEKDKKEKKFALFDLSTHVNYNFVAKTRKLSTLRSVLRSYAIPNVDIYMSATHDFYDEKTNEIKMKPPRLLNFSINTNINLSGKAFPSTSAVADTETVSASRAQSKSWGLRISHRYSERRVYGGVIKNQWASISTGFWLTSNWHLNYVNRYDFVQKKITERSFELYRDLHCWEARFSWVLQGYRSGYYFKINIKSLPEVKIEKSRGGLRDIFF